MAFVKNACAAVVSLIIYFTSAMIDTATTQSQPIPVMLLTGFLGSGKTTLLNHLVQQPFFARTLVIINEFGKISLDHLLVTHSNETVVMEMENGCVCCTIRSDLAKTLKDVIWRFSRNGERSFDRVVIETTGLADPAPILHTLITERNITRRYRLDAVITTIDTANAMDTLDHHPEAVKQAAVADRLVFTKSDLTSNQQLILLQQRLSNLNPAAKQITTVNAQSDFQSLFNASLFSIDQKIPEVAQWLNAEAYDRPVRTFKPVTVNAGIGGLHLKNKTAVISKDINRHHDHIHAYCFTINDPIDPELFDDWFGLLIAIKGPDILRIKGILNMKNRKGPLIIHGVQHIFHPPEELPDWPSDDRRSRIVFITRDVPRTVIADTFQALASSPRNNYVQ